MLSRMSSFSRLSNTHAYRPHIINEIMESHVPTVKTEVLIEVGPAWSALVISLAHYSTPAPSLVNNNITVPTTHNILNVTFTCNTRTVTTCLILVSQCHQYEMTHYLDHGVIVSMWISPIFLGLCVCQLRGMSVLWYRRPDGPGRADDLIGEYCKDKNNE